MLWDFNRFDIHSSQWVKEAFSKKKYAFAADYIRLYALYNYGGIYMDMDVEVLKSFDPFLKLKTMICFENSKQGLEMATFGVEKGAAWVKECLKYYENRSFIKADGMLDTITLPFIIQQICLKDSYRLEPVYSIEEALQKETGNALAILSSDYFSPKTTFRDEKIVLTSNTVSIHHFKGTWLPWYSKIEKRVSNILGFESKDFIRAAIYKIQLEVAKRKIKK